MADNKQFWDKFSNYLLNNANINIPAKAGDNTWFEIKNPITDRGLPLKNCRR
jgi:hypothetical protein